MTDALQAMIATIETSIPIADAVIAGYAEMLEDYSRLRGEMQGRWHSPRYNAEILGSPREATFSLTKGTDRAFILIAAL